MEVLMTESQNLQTEKVFVAKSLYRELQQGSDISHLVFNDMVQLVQGNPNLDDKKVMAQINQSLPLRRQYMQLLKQFSFAYSPAQAAASSSDKVTQRLSDGFELLYKEDKQFSGQVYVILKIDNPKEKHINIGVNVNCCYQNEIVSVHFPNVSDGKTQILMDASDLRFQQLFDPEIEIYLV